MDICDGKLELNSYNTPLFKKVFSYNNQPMMSDPRKFIGDRWIDGDGVLDSNVASERIKGRIRQRSSEVCGLCGRPAHQAAANILPKLDTQLDCLKIHVSLPRNDC